METENTSTKKPPPPQPPESDSTVEVTGSHISLSPPPGNSPALSSVSSPEVDTVHHPIPPHSDHISLSPPPVNSSARSSISSPTLSPLKIFTVPHPNPPQSDHITLSPQLRNSPARSSVSSDRTTITHGSSPENEICNSPEKQQVITHLPLVVNWAVPEEPVEVVNKADPGGGAVEGGGGNGRRRVKPSLSILRRAQRERMVKKAALGFRVFGFLFCLVSFAVMAADRNQGWALDSFQRYKEFMYCMSVNAIGFIYSGAQALDLSYNFATGKYVQQRLRHCFDFAVDQAILVAGNEDPKNLKSYCLWQVIAYLLMSASSSAATRIDDWQSNWGKDKFPDMATASVSMSFLAFVAVAFNSLISGYALFTSKAL
ncbi:hypothetical protein RD792_016611 [Penstemon davidsonii]|uniref:CASP-like protein n=1 Tax=Penstemon davidsonii TaxID=160366 RepID=A0ABR0CJW9_9LAMI|nr:hypothetical protein RD792_016611 [Penstemon davidsonii]